MEDAGEGVNGGGRLEPPVGPPRTRWWRSTAIEPEVIGGLQFLQLLGQRSQLHRMCPQPPVRPTRQFLVVGMARQVAIGEHRQSGSYASVRPQLGHGGALPRAVQVHRGLALEVLRVVGEPPRDAPPGRGALDWCGRARRSRTRGRGVPGTGGPPQGARMERGGVGPRGPARARGPVPCRPSSFPVRRTYENETQSSSCPRSPGGPPCLDRSVRAASIHRCS